MNTVYLNGDYLPGNEAKISVFDRGFLFADGIYEVIPVYAGRPFRLEEHLRRLNDSFQAIRMKNPLGDSDWAAIITGLLDANVAGNGDFSVYLQVSRGSSGARDHGIPTNIPPTIFACLNALQPIPDTIREKGVAATTADDIRWDWCHIKSIALLPNVLLREEAVAAGANEVILLREGRVIEGSTSNVFVVRNGHIVTPPHSQEMLPGVTRDLVVELTRNADLDVLEDIITEGDLRAADEIWLSSSTRELYPVTQLDGQPVGLGIPGSVWKQSLALLQAYKTKLRRGTGHD